MGKVFLKHLGGERIYSCAACSTAFTHLGHLVSPYFQGQTGRAFLFGKVVNTSFGKIKDKKMITGRHLIRDAFCKRCKTKVGWKYEFAVDQGQRYKEGCVVLEKALLTRSFGIEEQTDSEESIAE